MSTIFRVIIRRRREVPEDSTASGVGTVIFDSAVAASYSFDIQGLDFGPITASGLHYGGKMMGGNHRPECPILPRTVDALSIRHALFRFQRTTLLGR